MRQKAALEEIRPSPVVWVAHGQQFVNDSTGQTATLRLTLINPSPALMKTIALLISLVTVVTVCGAFGAEPADAVVSLIGLRFELVAERAQPDLRVAELHPGLGVARVERVEGAVQQGDPVIHGASMAASIPAR